MKLGFFSRNLKRPVVIAVAIIAIAVGGSLYMKHRTPVVQAPHDQAVMEASGIDAPVAPDYSVTSSQAIAYEDELQGQISKTIYKCANGEYFTARVEVTGSSSNGGKAEIFLKDYSKILVTQTISDSGVRYENKGGSFIFSTKGETAFIQEGEQLSYPDCVAQ